MTILEAELELLLSPEVAAVNLKLMLRAGRVVEIVRPVPGSAAAIVDNVGVAAALRREREGAMDVRVLCRHERRRAECHRVFELVHARRARLIERGLRRSRHACVAPLLLLVAAEVEERRIVRAVRLPGQFGVVVDQLRVVGESGDDDVLDVILRRRAPEPQLVLHERAASFHCQSRDELRSTRPESRD